MLGNCEHFLEAGWGEVLLGSASKIVYKKTNTSSLSSKRSLLALLGMVGMGRMGVVKGRISVKNSQ